MTVSLSSLDVNSTSASVLVVLASIVGQQKKMGILSVCVYVVVDLQ